MLEIGGAVFVLTASLLKTALREKKKGFLDPGAPPLGVHNTLPPRDSSLVFHPFQRFSHLITLTESLGLECNDFGCLFISLYIT